MAIGASRRCKAPLPTRLVERGLPAERRGSRRRPDSCSERALPRDRGGRRLAERRRRSPGQGPQREAGGFLPTCRGLAARRRDRSHEVADSHCGEVQRPARGAEMLVQPVDAGGQFGGGFVTGAKLLRAVEKAFGKAQRQHPAEGGPDASACVGPSAVLCSSADSVRRR